MKGPLFYAKILLFGEYGIIKDSKGLAIPFNAYRGALKTSENLEGISKKSNENLLKFYNYISSLNTDLVSFNLLEFSKKYNFSAFKVDVSPPFAGLSVNDACLSASLTFSTLVDKRQEIPCFFMIFFCLISGVTTKVTSTQVIKSLSIQTALNCVSSIFT